MKGKKQTETWNTADKGGDTQTKHLFLSLRQTALPGSVSQSQTDSVTWLISQSKTHSVTWLISLRQTLTHTVEVGSLQTLRLESLKLVFQPLHKFLVNKL